MAAEDPTLAAALAVDKWLRGSRSAWQSGHPVHLVVSPGDLTCYAMVFTPPIGRVNVTDGDYHRMSPSEGVISLLTCEQTCAVVNMDGTPFPSYVASHLKIKNPWTIAAVGMVWHLMVNNTPEDTALAYAEYADQYAEWDLERFA